MERLLLLARRQVPVLAATAALAGCVVQTASSPSGGSSMVFAAPQQAASPVSRGDSRAASSTLPIFRRSEIAKHKTRDTRIWITYKEGVYDVTDFVDKHPGGNRILLAAGASADPFWGVYPQHKHPHVYELLDKMRVGTLHPDDMAAEHAKSAAAGTTSADNPFANDPMRHPALVVHTQRPCNAETPAALLADSFITPSDLMFVRNHMPVPDINPATYKLEIVRETPRADSSASSSSRAGRASAHAAVDESGGASAWDRTTVLTLSLEQLKALPSHTIVAAIQCTGNRRRHMNEDSKRPTKGLSWDVGAIGNVEWKGVWLSDVLASAGITERDIGPSFQHVHFEGLDGDPLTHTHYSASIPADRAVDRHYDTLLAYEMNGKPLPRDHGFPVRAIVPGVTGTRQVKWLGAVVVSPRESDSVWQQKDYKLFAPSVDWNTVDFSAMPAIQEMPVQSAICDPIDGASVPLDADGDVVVKGFAWSGGGRSIVRVDVSADGGVTWHTADLVAQPEDKSPSRNKSWGWTLWEAVVPVPVAVTGADNSSASGGPTGIGTGGRRKVELMCRATDVSMTSQPEHVGPAWNYRGLCMNAWHRVNVTLMPQSPPTTLSSASSAGSGAAAGGASRLS